MTMSPGSALRRITGLQQARVQTPPNGFGENPLSCLTIYAISFTALTIWQNCYRSGDFVLKPPGKASVYREFPKSLRPDNLDMTREDARAGHEIVVGRMHDEEDSAKVLNRELSNGIPKIGESCPRFYLHDVAIPGDRFPE